MRIVPILLAGGRGERFWPLSRRSRPKQLLPLLSDRPMIADTLERTRGLAAPGDAWILTARDLREAVRASVPELPPERVVGEPVGKNTAPAVALAAWWLRGEGDETVAAILPSDHRIEPASRFREDLAAAARAALAHRAIVTLGIRPTRAETGYGYIEVGEPLEPGSAIRSVRAFREKPDPVTAARYAADGKHLWNAGMFLFAPGVMLEEIGAHAPEIAKLLETVGPDPGPGFERALEDYYAAAPSISIDYAVMERTRRAAVLEAGFAWDDLGSWAALAGDRAPGETDRENWVRGRALLEDSSRVIAFAEDGLIAALGVEDLVIVRTRDVTLVCPRERAQEVRALVDRLKRDRDGASLL